MRGNMRPMLFVGVPAKHQQWKTALLATATLMFLGTVCGAARANDECGPMAGQTVTCNQPSYPAPGIAYAGGSVTLNNPSMVVNGDIVIGSGGALTQAILTASQFQSITGDISTTTRSSNGLSRIDLAPGVSGAQVGGTLNATVNGAGTAWISIDGVAVSGNINALNNGSGDALVTVSGASTVSDAVSASTKNGDARVEISSGATFNSSGPAPAISATATGLAGASEIVIGAVDDTTGPTLTSAGSDGGNIAFAQTGLSNAGDAAITIESGIIFLNSDNSVGLFAEAMGSGDATVTMNNGTVNVGSPDSQESNRTNQVGLQAGAASGKTIINVTGGSITATRESFAAIATAMGDATNLDPTATVDAIITIGPDATIYTHHIPYESQSSATAFWNSMGAADSYVEINSSGSINGDLMMGGGNSQVTISGGNVAGYILGDYYVYSGYSPGPNPGDDHLIWTGGTIVGAFYGQGGNDTVTIRAENGADLSINTPGFDGGGDKGPIDRFIFQSPASSVFFESITNFERMLIDNVAVTFSQVGNLVLILDGFTENGQTYDNGILTVQGPNGSFAPVANNEAVLQAGVELVSGGTFDASVVDTHIQGDLVNGGFVKLAGDSDFQQLTIDLDYTGKASSTPTATPVGLIALDVNLAVGGQNDNLLIERRASGTTYLTVSGRGQATTPNRYTLIHVNAASNMTGDEFVLLGSGIIGPYTFKLIYDFNSDSGEADIIFAPANSADVARRLDEDFLRRAGMRELVAAGVALQPYVPLYEAYPSVLLDMMAMPSFETRSGGRYDHGEALSSGPALDAVWGRVERAFSHNDPEDATTGYDTDLSRMELQAGLDGLFLDNDAGTLIASLTGHYKDGEAKVGSPFGGSKIRPEGWGFGGTVTWLGASGFYVDGQADLTWFTSELKADSLPLAPEDGDAFGYGLSAEIGQRITLSEGFSLTPQAQLAFSNVSIDGFTGAYGESINFDDGQSLVGRLGLGLEKLSQWQDAAGKTRAARLYGTASINHDFLGDTTAVLDAIYDLDSSPDVWSGEIAFGGSYDFETGKTRIGLYAELTATTGFDTGSYGYGGNLGLKVRW